MTKHTPHDRPNRIPSIKSKSHPSEKGDSRVSLVPVVARFPSLERAEERTWRSNRRNPFSLPRKSLLAEGRSHKEVTGGPARSGSEARGSIAFIMDPWGCISHGVTARWSIEFLSPFRRDLHPNEAPMGSREPNQHLPTATTPL
ncbi:hypothetical protein KM043_008330 [Ampulex compressa]|nr:hypothetical protein KM043_008330 [Ampulex compressa]